MASFPADPTPLTSGNTRVKNARKLARRSFRAEERLFLADGPKAVEGALGVPGCVVEVFATPEATRQYAALAAAAPVWTLVDDRALASLSDSVNPAGVVAVARFLDPPAGPRPGPVSVPRPPPRWSSPLLGGRARPVVGGRARPVVGGRARRSWCGGRASGRRWSTCRDHPPRDLRRRPRPRQRGDRGPLRRRGRSRRGGVRRATRSTRTTPRRCGPRSAASSTCRSLSSPIPRPPARRPGGRARGPGRRWRRGGSTSTRPTTCSPRPTAWLFGNEAWGLPEELAALADHRVRIPIHGRAESLSLLDGRGALPLRLGARPAHRPARASLRRPVIPGSGVGGGYYDQRPSAGCPARAPCSVHAAGRGPLDNWSRHVPYHSSSLVSDHLRHHRRVPPRDHRAGVGQGRPAAPAVVLDCFGDFGDPTIPDVTAPDVAVNYAGDAACVGIRVTSTSVRLAWVVLAPGWSYVVKRNGGGTNRPGGAAVLQPRPVTSSTSATSVGTGPRSADPRSPRRAVDLHPQGSGPRVTT